VGNADCGWNGPLQTEWSLAREMRGVERSRREDGVQKTVGVELQIEDERRRARREMAARKGSWERADVPAPKECEGMPGVASGSRRVRRW
jgi:hypothetical protein